MAFAVAKNASACDCTMQVVLKTLIQNLPVCTHIHGLDTLFDVEACIAHVAHMLNITCTDQINVSFDFILLIICMCHLYEGSQSFVGFVYLLPRNELHYD